MTEAPLQYESLMKELLRGASRDRQPAFGTFDLTSRCNLSCRMCFVRHTAGDRSQVARELSAATWLKLAHEAVDSGMVFLLLTGGEVFLRRDFFEIYEPLTRMGLVLSLFTNGTLITEDIATRLAEAPPSRTEITLYGATAATYEAITNVPGSYAACCRGIEALVSRGIPLGLKTTITRQNVSELNAMRQMAHKWGVPFSGSWLLLKRLDGTPSQAEDCRLSASESVALESTGSASANEWPEPALREIAVGSREIFSCHAGKSAFVINPEGDMNVCEILNQPAAKPLETGFSGAWKKVQHYVDSAPPAVSECCDCDVLKYCLGCPAWSLIETGTLTDPVPYLCEIAHARKELYEQHY